MPHRGQGSRVVLVNVGLVHCISLLHSNHSAVGTQKPCVSKRNLLLTSRLILSCYFWMDSIQILGQLFTIAQEQYPLYSCWMTEGAGGSGENIPSNHNWVPSYLCRWRYSTRVTLLPGHLDTRSRASCVLGNREASVRHVTDCPVCHPSSSSAPWPAGSLCTGHHLYFCLTRVVHQLVHMYFNVPDTKLICFFSRMNCPLIVPDGRKPCSNCERRFSSVSTCLLFLC